MIFHGTEAGDYQAVWMELPVRERKDQPAKNHTGTPSAHRILLKTILEANAAGGGDYFDVVGLVYYACRSNRSDYRRRTYWP